MDHDSMEPPTPPFPLYNGLIIGPSNNLKNLNGLWILWPPPPLPLNGPFFGPIYVKKNLNGLSVILDPPSPPLMD